MKCKDPDISHYEVWECVSCGEEFDSEAKAEKHLRENEK